MDKIDLKVTLLRPVVFFDFETTGVDSSNDRIIEISAQKVNIDGTIEKFYSLVNPCRPIPKEASDVNGITDEDVKNSPTFLQISDDLLKFIGDSDLGGYNVLGYDIPLLIEECARIGIQFKYGNRQIMDSFYIFKKKEARNLTKAVEFYLGEELEEAHSAEADTSASMRVFFAQLEKYGFQSTNAASEFVKEGIVDLKGKFRRNAEGLICFTFGKYANQSVLEVSKRDPGYIEWILTNPDFSTDTRKHLRLIVKEIEK